MQFEIFIFLIIICIIFSIEAWGSRRSRSSRGSWMVPLVRTTFFWGTMTSDEEAFFGISFSSWNFWEKSSGFQESQATNLFKIVLTPAFRWSTGIFGFLVLGQGIGLNTDRIGVPRGGLLGVLKTSQFSHKNPAKQPANSPDSNCPVSHSGGSLPAPQPRQHPPATHHPNPSVSPRNFPLESILKIKRPTFSIILFLYLVFRILIWTHCSHLNEWKTNENCKKKTNVFVFFVNVWESDFLNRK